MKNLITILILLVAAGCLREVETETQTETETERVFHGDQPPIDLPLVGTYKRVMHPSKEYYYHMMLRKDGVCENYWLNDDGNESDEEREIANWEVKNDELTVTHQKKESQFKNVIGGKISMQTYVFRIEEDGDSLTQIAYGWTTLGKFERRDKALKDYVTWKKIK